MPTYEYRCKDCGHEFEAVQSFADDALTDCPTCQGTLRKVFGNVGITFKGSGFYKNDSRAGTSGAKESAKDGGSESGGSSSGDSKPGTKSESSSSTSSSTSSGSSSPAKETKAAAAPA